MPFIPPGPTLRKWRDRLPHWELKSGSYFITIHCAGSIPRDAMRRIFELRQSLAVVESRSPEFLQLQRTIFRTAEKYLDQGIGFSPFVNSACNQVVEEALGKLAHGWQVDHWVLMPNHFHVIASVDTEGRSLKKTWQQFKGRTARACNEALGRSGTFWHRNWFDRWIRSEREYAKTVDYIRANPVKAKLVNSPDDYRWLR